MGAGKRLNVSLARLVAAEGMRVALAARDASKLADLVDETGVLALHCGASRPDDVKALFDRIDDALGARDLVVYNASARYRAAVEDIDAEKREDAFKVTAVGGFLVAQAAAVRRPLQDTMPGHAMKKMDAHESDMHPMSPDDAMSPAKTGQ